MSNSGGGANLRVLGAAALLGAAGLAGWTATRTPSTGFDVEAFGRTVEGRLGEASAGLHIRVATLAELPRLAVAVATDARTVGDLTQDELAFRPHPGETIAIGQLPKRAGKGPVLLRLAPAGANRPSFELGGPRLRIAGQSLVATEAIAVVPRVRANDLDGVVAVSWDIDLAPLSAPLVEAGAQAQLTVDGGTLTLGASRPAPGATARSVRLELRRTSSSADRSQVDLIVRAPASPQSAPWMWGGVAALVLLGVGAIGWSRRKIKTGSFEQAPAPLWAPGSGAGLSGPTLTNTLVGPASSSNPTRVATPGSGAIPQVAIGRIGRYDLLRKIGIGGMAEVYLARSTGEAGFAKLVALKVLLPDFASQAQVVDNFLDEARLAAQLYHPNIVQTVDLGRAGDHYFMAMEYIDGTDLLRLIGICESRRKPIPLPVALAILRGICAGLQAAHEACQPDGQPLDLVHRDVKSANVFVSRNGVVKVGDFGIAKAHHAGWVRRTENGLVKGTPGYMAPEQRLGQAIDGRADLYGVGAIAYELLTGQPVNLDLALLAAKGKEGWPHLASIDSIRRDVPPELEGIVMRTLAFDREDRFPSCAALEQAFEAVAVANPPVAGDKAIARWIDDLLAGEARFAEVTSLASVAALGR